MIATTTNDEENNSSDSDYVVEMHVKPKRIRRTVNDDSADLLGNFDDEKRNEIHMGTYEEKDPYKNPSDLEDSIESEDDDNDSDSGSEGNDDEADDDHTADTSDEANDGDTSNDVNTNNGVVYPENNDSTPSKINTNLTKDQLTVLLRGASKVNRHVVYVTNLNFDTTKEDIEQHFVPAGVVKSVRIPKKRRGGYAFVEMPDLDSFQRAFQLHNTELQGRRIKIQISEAGRKKSANKKNILKQKNRKLAEMRNEPKTFTKSGKFYDKALKKEKAKELLQRKRWRKKPAAMPNRG